MLYYYEDEAVKRLFTAFWEAMSSMSRAERRGHKFSANIRLANVTAWHETRDAARHTKWDNPNPNPVEDDARMYHGICRAISHKDSRTGDRVNTVRVR